MSSLIADLLANTGLRVLSLEQSQSIHQSGMAAQQRLYDLIKPLFPEGNVYPDTAHDNRSFPDCVYSVADTGSVGYRNMDVSHSVLFGLSIRDKNQADLVSKFDEITQALHPQSGVQILGYATGYEHNTGDGGNYVIGIEVLVSSPVGEDAGNAQRYPLQVLPGACLGVEPQYNNCSTQNIDCEYHVISHADSMTALQTHRVQVQQALLGKMPDAADGRQPLYFAKGEPLQAEGGLLAWVDVWKSRYRIKAHAAHE